MIERAEFGRTGHLSSRVIFGGAALSTASQEEADPLLDVLLEFGVNHWDTAAGYGVAEDRMKPWLATHRDDVFLATKTGDWEGDAARASLERSLERMGVDHVDLIQLHNLVEEDDWQTAHGPGGALEALVQARDEGLTRFIGVTGHGVRIAAMHARSLERFDYDSVLLPYNFVQLEDAQYRADVEHLLGVCAERRVAVQAIKAVARRRWADEATEAAAARGTSRCRPATPSSAPCASSSTASSCSCWRAATRRLLRAILTAASTPAEPPTADQLRADVAAADMQPLFDGADLERI